MWGLKCFEEAVPAGKPSNVTEFKEERGTLPPQRREALIAQRQLRSHNQVLGLGWSYFFTQVGLESFLPVNQIIIDHIKICLMICKCEKCKNANKQGNVLLFLCFRSTCAARSP